MATTMTKLTLREMRDLILKAEEQGLKSDDFFIDAFVPDEKKFM